MNEPYKAYIKKRQKQIDAQARKRMGGPFMRLIVSLAGVAFVVYCAASVVLTQADIAEKRQELELLNEKAAELELENEEFASILSEEDERTYMERIAIDVLGYAYPNERRFYDTTRS